jgi:competence protein CoiA
MPQFEETLTRYKEARAALAAQIGEVRLDGLSRAAAVINDTSPRFRRLRLRSSGPICSTPRRGFVFSMLTAVRSRNDSRVLAWDAERAEQPFHCPECLAEVILKQGRVRIHHFAHLPPVTCRYGRGETEEHRRCKLALYDGLRTAPGVENVELEYPVANQRADVLATIRGARVAFEVQVSILSLEDLNSRTAGYSRAGVAVCWMHPSALDGISAGIQSGRYSPKQWERWIHAANYGRCYYWNEHLWVQPVHFDPHMLEVEVRTWFESGGYEQSAGGYSKYSRRYRTPVIGQLAHLVRDFTPTRRHVYDREAIHVPACTIYIDRQDKWWSSRPREE